MAWRPRVLSIARAVDRAVELGCNFLLLTAGLGLLCLLTVVVVLRYAFASGLTFATDLTELLFAIFVMAGIALAALRGVHVATQLLLHRLRGGLRMALAVAIHVVTAVTYLLLAWYALQNAIIAHDQTSPVMEIPWSVGYGCLALGLALVATCSLTAIARHALGGEVVKVDLADAGAAVT
jgi:TRAP-type C4-dicarboxylate transport system permease small subunit